jgi:hypothetical protein
MTRCVRFAFVAFACALASGCITAITTIKLKPDGSGTIEQSVAMKAEVAQQFADMAAGFGAAPARPGAKAEPPELFSEKEMREGATKYGEGVTFVSSHPIKTKEMVGRVATYAFTDITKVHVNQKPPSPKEGMAPPQTGPEDVLFKFARKPVGTSLVTVVFPEPDLTKKKPPTADGKEEPKEKDKHKPDPQQLEMMKKMFDGLHIEIALDVAGAIVKTNSPYVQGSKVTLLEMDFSELLTNEKMLEAVAEPNSIEEAKKMLEGVKGFKVNLDREVAVEFK